MDEPNTMVLRMRDAGSAGGATQAPVGLAADAGAIEEQGAGS